MRRLPSGGRGGLCTCERRTAGVLHKLVLGELDARAVGIGDVELNFAIGAEQFGVAALGRFPAALFELLLELGGAGNAGSKMISAAQLRERRMLGQVKHVLDPVGAI